MRHYIVETIKGTEQVQADAYFYDKDWVGFHLLKNPGQNVILFNTAHVISVRDQGEVSKDATK